MTYHYSREYGRAGGDNYGRDSDSRGGDDRRGDNYGRDSDSRGGDDRRGDNYRRRDSHGGDDRRGDNYGRRDSRGGDDNYGRGSGDRRRHDNYDQRRDRSRERHHHHQQHHRGGHHNKVDERSFVEKPLSTEIDENLRLLNDDPRVDAEKGLKKVKNPDFKGRNSESFDPRSTLVRPDLRVIVGPKRDELNKPLKHDDVLIVPEFFSSEDDWKLYYDLVEEMRELQAKNEKGSEWISWHENSHLIVKNPQGSKTFKMIQDKIAKYFGIKQESIGTRFNWYRTSDDWKPFHHDSAAFNASRAANQNITVGVSFGATRELAFLNAHNGTKAYFPQTNGMLFSFGRDVNINWKHGINALPESEQDGKGRISIILWGKVNNVIEEENSPPMLTDNTRGMGYSMHR